MGNLQASEMASLVQDGTAQLSAALHWHLFSNHYPPLPPQALELAEKSLEAWNNGDDVIEVPFGDDYPEVERKDIPLSVIFDATNLWAFVSNRDEIPDDEDEGHIWDDDDEGVDLPIYDEAEIAGSYE